MKSSTVLLLLLLISLTGFAQSTPALPSFTQRKKDQKPKKQKGLCDPEKIRPIKKCYCYLIVTRQIAVVNPRVEATVCFSYFGSELTLRGYAQTCIPFFNPVGKVKTKQLIKRLNKFSTKCGNGDLIELE